jgi:hypothetical protein
MTSVQSDEKSVVIKKTNIHERLLESQARANIIALKILSRHIAILPDDMESKAYLKNAYRYYYNVIGQNTEDSSLCQRLDEVLGNEYPLLLERSEALVDRQPDLLLSMFTLVDMPPPDENVTRFCYDKLKDGSDNTVDEKGNWWNAWMECYRTCVVANVYYKIPIVRSFLGFMSTKRTSTNPNDIMASAKDLMCDADMMSIVNEFMSKDDSEINAIMNDMKKMIACFAETFQGGKKISMEEHVKNQKKGLEDILKMIKKPGCQAALEDEKKFDQLLESVLENDKSGVADSDGWMKFTVWKRVRTHFRSNNLHKRPLSMGEIMNTMNDSFDEISEAITSKDEARVEEILKRQGEKLNIDTDQFQEFAEKIEAASQDQSTQDQSTQDQSNQDQSNQDQSNHVDDDKKNTDQTEIEENTDQTENEENTDQTENEENTDQTEIEENTDQTEIEENTDQTEIEENTNV